MFKMKKVVDERQELELLKIEHICFWVVFWGLFISIIVQSVFMDVPFKQYAAEFFVFMAGCIGILVGCVKKGQWDFYTKPTMKTYILTSIIGSVAYSLIFAIAKYNKYEFFRENILTGLLPSMLIIALFMFVLIFFSCLLMGKMVTKKQARLEKEFSDDK